MGYTLIYIFIIFIAVIIVREIVMWYWKINEIVLQLEKQNEILKIIAKQLEDK